MSTASSPGVPPESAFRELVFEEPTVCSRCFKLIRRMDTYRVDVGLGGVSKHAPVERLVRWHEGERGYKVETNNEYGYRPLHRPRTFCGECGSQSGRADDETLSQRFAVSVVDNLVDRLQERDVDINYTAVRYCVKKLKSKPETKDYDTEIFERATKLGIKRARYNSR